MADQGTFTPPAYKLKTATTEVSVGGATAPTNGQVLTASSGTAASWATPAAGGSSVGATLYLFATQGGL